MIEVSGLTKRYKDGTVALDKVSFKLDKKVTAVIGKNGAGKTTLLRILSTQMLPTSGSATINGYDVIKQPNRIREIAVSIPQESRPMPYINAIDSVRLYLAARGVPFHVAGGRAEKALKAIGLWEAKDKLTDELSGGMKRKIYVAMALASDADIVFLDEPTTGLDPFSRIEVWSAIRTLRSQVILTTHYMEEAQVLSNDVLMVDKGKIIQHGPVAQLLGPFEGMMRIESARKKPGAYAVGNVWVSYVKKADAKKFVEEGDVVKPITLDDLFIKRGVNLES